MNKLFYAICVCLLVCMSCSTSSKPHKKLTGARPQSRLDSSSTARLMTLLDHYDQLKNALTEDHAQKATQAAGQISRESEVMIAALQEKDSSSETELINILETVRTVAAKLKWTKDETTEKQRLMFAPLSDAMYLLAKNVRLKNTGLYRQYCPMALNDSGAYWLSRDEEIRNPYFGSKMLECGEISDTLE